MAKPKVEEPTKEESTFVEDLGLDEATPKPKPDEPKPEPGPEERVELDARAEEVGLEAGASVENIEAAELSARAEEVGLGKDASLEDVETAELSARAEAVGLETDATLEEVEAAEKKAEEEKPEVPQKDLTQEEINKLPRNVQGMYYEMKKEREKHAATKAKVQFLELQLKYNKPKEAKPKEEETEEVETIETILAGKEDDDVPSVGQLRRISAAQKKKAEIAEKKAKDARANVDANAKKMDEMEDAFKIDHPDYDDMLNVFAQACQDTPSLRLEIIAETNREGGNPAKRMYDIAKKLKGAYREAEPSAPRKPSAAERIKENAKKRKPSASVAGSSVSNEALEEMEIEELGKTLSNMSMKEFMKVPKKIRERAMK